MLVVLGIASGLCWGTADFFGGLQSRRLSAFAVALWSQLAGALALALVLTLVGGTPTTAGVAWGAAGGVFGGGALVLFYRGLAQGVMSVVAPVSACGALVPVLVELALGETPGAVASAGIAAVIAGIVLVSLQPGGTPESRASFRGSLLLALGAALGFGLFFVFLDRGTAAGGASPLWTVGGARVGSLGVLLALLASRPRSAPWPGPRWPQVAMIGVLDTTANGLFAYAAIQGDLGVAAVLGSLYPVATVLLGRVLLSERLSRVQGVGVTLAMAGVALLSAG